MFLRYYYTSNSENKMKSLCMGLQLSSTDLSLSKDWKHSFIRSGDEVALDFLNLSNILSFPDRFNEAIPSSTWLWSAISPLKLQT